MNIDELLGGLAEAVNAEADKLVASIEERPLYIPSLFPEGMKREYCEFYKQVVERVKENPNILNHENFLFVFPTAEKFPYLRVDKTRYGTFNDITREETANRLFIVPGKSTLSFERLGYYSEGIMYKVILFPENTFMDQTIYLPVPQKRPKFQAEMEGPK